jgi:hypothetical protein
MENLFKPNVNESVVDNLISGTLAQAKVESVTITGTGIVKRGTLLYSADGETFAAWDPDGTVEIATEGGEDSVRSPQEIQAVLLADVDAEDEDSNVGPAAFGGEFNQNKIEEVMGITLSATAILAARAKQIFIAPMNPAPETF